ncbi:sensor histidine kinase [Herbidospora cretacea]|uniref:sensor histidine kinase n=1 Tax=Herbidospora cretacea TaxID=28444 RepID=UPI0004C2C3AF|nr:HAMP domain-containing sensor histidine kinase [Herbidospora cretacea]
MDNPLKSFPKSIRARRTLVFCVVAAMMSIAFSVVFLLFEGDQEVQASQARISKTLDYVLPLLGTENLPTVLPGDKDLAVQVVDSGGRTVAASRQLVGRPPMVAFPSAAAISRSEQALCPPAGLTGCMTVGSFKIYRPDGYWLLHVATPVTPWYGSGTALVFVTGMSVLMTAMVAGGTFYLVNRDISAITAIGTELAEINAAELDRRVPVADANQEEIKHLAETVNDTLDRLERAYHQLRQFTADASHDLRSPLTAMRTQLEEAVMHPEDTDWPATSAAVLASVDRLQSIVADLLTLARLDAGAPLSPHPTDLGRLVDDELDRRVCRTRYVKDVQSDVVVAGDRLGLTRLLVNLVDNAERHAESAITVTVRADGPTAILEVLDDGDGIASEDREKVFARFTRLDASRNRDAGGTGLGLSIAREIAKAHHGTLTIEDSDRGARFVLRLPAVS